MMKGAFRRILLTCSILALQQQVFCWGFYGHRTINYYAVFLLPPRMLMLFKPNIDFITDHAVDPDKRRYIIKEEGPRHYIDLDHYGHLPFDALPRSWKDAEAKFGEDTLRAHGIVPWWIPIMMQRLTNAFKEKNQAKILKLSAELGHYVADAHVPLHTNSNHNGQYTNQQGIHGFWESRIPELLAEKTFDFFIGKAAYISNPSEFMWKRILESSAASDTVLRVEKELTSQFGGNLKFAFEERNGLLQRQYSTAFTMAYNSGLKGMVERRMRQSIFAVASLWLTAWVNAGQPDLSGLSGRDFSPDEKAQFEELDKAWKSGAILGRSCDN